MSSGDPADLVASESEADERPSSAGRPLLAECPTCCCDSPQCPADGWCGCDNRFCRNEWHDFNKPAVEHA